MNAAADASASDASGPLLIVVGETGALLEWNRPVSEVAGYSESDLAGMDLADLFGPDGAAGIAEAAWEGHGTGTVEAALETVAGERIPYELEASRMTGGGSERAVVVGRGLADGQAGRTLENRQRVLREMYEIIADRESPFVDQVGALLRLGRREIDTAYGTLSEIRGDEYVFEVVDAADDSIAAGDVVPVSETNCEIVAGNEETLALGNIARDAPGETDRAGYTEWGISCYLGAPVYGTDGVYGTLCFYDTEARIEGFSDWEVTLVDLMSRWVSYELQHRQTNDRLTRKNQTLERFATIVSHDLRNPLNVLQGSLELAEESGDADQFERCHRAVARMEELIQDLLELARAGASIEEMAPVDLGAVTNRCWNGVETGGATLRVESTETVLADESRLRQLLGNLVRNAVEHNESAVTVTVGTTEGGFYVADDGRGIPESEREEVFESGYSTAEDGTGFGLSIVAEIAEAHGWSVRLTESAAGGARFEFTDVDTE